MKLTYEALLADPRLLQESLAEARRARADAVHRYLIAPLVRLFSDQPPLRQTRMLHRSATC
jgi:hypothetical protein